MLTNVIFDMDGVIVDSHEAHIRTWKKFLLSLGKSVSDADLSFVRQGRKKQEILRFFLGELPDDQIQAHCHIKDVLFRSEVQGIKMLPGVQELLEDLKHAGVPIALASCGGTARVHHLLSRLRLRDYFAVIVTGDDVTFGKPDPEIFRRAARHLQVHPAESIVFEDSVSGIRGAKAAGMKCVAIADRQLAPALVQAGADYVLPNFSGLSWIGLQKLFALSSKLLQ
jgi:HAD superfamily hydrolase (TIGR01509 family)